MVHTYRGDCHAGDWRRTGGAGEAGGIEKKALGDRHWANVKSRVTFNVSTLKRSEMVHERLLVMKGI